VNLETDDEGADDDDMFQSVQADGCDLSRFADCTIHRERFLLLTKSLIAIRDRSPAQQDDREPD